MSDTPITDDAEYEGPSKGVVSVDSSLSRDIERAANVMEAALDKMTSAYKDSEGKYQHMLHCNFMGLPPQLKKCNCGLANGLAALEQYRKIKPQ